MTSYLRRTKNCWWNNICGWNKIISIIVDKTIVNKTIDNRTLLNQPFFSVFHSIKNMFHRPQLWQFEFLTAARKSMIMTSYLVPIVLPDCLFQLSTNFKLTYLPTNSQNFMGKKIFHKNIIFEFGGNLRLGSLCSHYCAN